MADPPGRLNLSALPQIHVLATQMDSEALQTLEQDLVSHQARLSPNIGDARIIITIAKKRGRVLFDLRAKGLWMEEVEPSPLEAMTDPGNLVHADKRRRLSKREGLLRGDELQVIVIDDDSSTEPEEECIDDQQSLNVDHTSNSLSPQMVRLITLDWFEQSKLKGITLPFEPFTIYIGHRIDRPQTPNKTALTKVLTNDPKTPVDSANDKGILERAREEASETPNGHGDRFGRGAFGKKRSLSTINNSTWSAGSSKHCARLLHRTTTEEGEGNSSEVLEMPDWVKSGVKYACERSTPKSSPNSEFIALLKTIRLGRTLTNDDIGVRAYSTSIAAIAAYPYKLTEPKEILALPGCEGKIANLFVEWINTGRIQMVEDLNDDPDLKVVRLFYDIWGVGASTAREFYFDRGWRDLDDIVEFGWSTLTRVQQIGVKYYEEFLNTIPRAEVEEIWRTVYEHAVRLRDDKMQGMIVGGYRRGNEACGDVDILISHPDEQKTAGIITELVESLEAEGWITHTLTLSVNNTKRDQQTLPFRTSSLHGGRSFDSLDKALVVWQDPNWATKEQDVRVDAEATNPNIHRRVDIIISPWRTVGCAVLGWSGATTFERDLRRYAKNVKHWKFDSSGIRDRGTGEVIDVERHYSAGEVGRAETMLEAEKRVFQGLGLEYREPWERCTE